VALVTAMVVMIPARRAGDRGARLRRQPSARTGDERVREAALPAGQDRAGGPDRRAWRRVAHHSRRAVPTSCASSGASAGCPTASTITAAFTGTDAAAGQWTTEIRDDLGLAAQQYRRDVLATAPCPAGTPCTWDSNANERCGSAHRRPCERTRTVVGLVRRPVIRVPLPRATTIAGRSRRRTPATSSSSTSSAAHRSPAWRTSCTSLQPGTAPGSLHHGGPAVGDAASPCATGRPRPLYRRLRPGRPHARAPGRIAGPGRGPGHRLLDPCTSAAQLTGSVVVEDQTCT
jgi:hypothetical protein